MLYSASCSHESIFFALRRTLNFKFDSEVVSSCLTKHPKTKHFIYFFMGIRYIQNTVISMTVQKS